MVPKAKKNLLVLRLIKFCNLFIIAMHIVIFFCDVTQLQAWKGSTPSNIVQRVADHDGSVIIQRGTLTGLEKFTLYTVAVVAYNGAGDSPRSDTKIIKTEEGGM